MPEKLLIQGQSIRMDATYFSSRFHGDVNRVEMKKLPLLKGLLHLNVAGADLYDSDLMIVGRLEGLKMLDLDLTDITDAGLRYLSGCSHLEDLRLKDNPQLTDGCVPHLLSLGSLNFLHLENTSITWDGVRSLIEGLDLCEIILDGDFKTYGREILVLSSEYPELEILIKGFALVKNGKHY